MTVRSTSDKVTLADVAAHAGVSTMTVSRVVNDHEDVRDETREKVRASIDALGYRPNIVARGLKAARSHTFGLLVPDITNPYFPEIVRGAEDVAFEAGYTVFLNNVIEDTGREARALQAFEDRRVDGVIACSPRLPEDRLHDLLARHDAAVVVNRHAPAEVAGTVRVEHEHGMRLAVEHLVGLGRRRIGVLAGPETSSAGRDRRRGILRTLHEHDMRIPDARWIHGPPTVDGGAVAAARLLDAEGDVDGLLCFNDLVAAGAMRKLRERGYAVPTDVAVIGYDDIAFARMFTPALTTLRVDTYELGVQAMHMLLDRMEGRRRTVGVVLQPELVVRTSTVPAEGGTP